MFRLRRNIYGTRYSRFCAKLNSTFGYYITKHYIRSPQVTYFLVYRPHSARLIQRYYRRGLPKFPVIHCKNKRTKLGCKISGYSRDPKIAQYMLLYAT